jgi:hypothetical protein
MGIEPKVLLVHVQKDNKWKLFLSFC